MLNQPNTKKLIKGWRRRGVSESRGLRWSEVMVRLIELDNGVASECGREESNNCEKQWDRNRKKTQWEIK